MQTGALEWYIYSHGQLIGPVPLELAQLFLRQRRVLASEFVWKEGMPGWVRALELPEFQEFAPPYPPIPLPIPNARKPAGSQPEGVYFRRYKRVPIQGTAAIEEYGRFQLVDISEAGIFAVGSPIIPILMNVQLAIESDAFILPIKGIQGRVVRHSVSSTGLSGFGVEFVDISDENRKKLQDYVGRFEQSGR